jgi:3',5'-cyclic AMP phosphodiesterase CpdA
MATRSGREVRVRRSAAPLANREADCNPDLICCIQSGMCLVDSGRRRLCIPAAPDPGRPFKLVHLTDFHLCRAHGAPLTAWVNKRALSYLAWQTRRRHENLPAVLSAMIDALAKLAWDQAAVTGDLTQLGLPAEFRLARRYLEAIGPPQRVMVVPGNHDALVKTPFETTFARWSDYMSPDDRPSGRPAETPPVFPTLRIRSHVALIGLSSAQPTWPFAAAGSLGDRQRRRLGEILAETGRKGYFRVVLVHHPLLPGQVSRRKRLTDAAALLGLLRRCGAELVLHGHAHRDLRGTLAGPAGAIPVLGLPATSAAHPSQDRRACLRIFSIHRPNAGWKLEVQDHAYTKDGGIVARPPRHSLIARATAHPPGR